MGSRLKMTVMIVTLLVGSFAAGAAAEMLLSPPSLQTERSTAEQNSSDSGGRSSPALPASATTAAANEVVFPEGVIPPANGLRYPEVTDEVREWNKGWGIDSPMPGFWDLTARLDHRDNSVVFSWHYGPCSPKGECVGGWTAPSRIAITRATCLDIPHGCAGDIPFKLLVELPASVTSWRDTTVQSGKEYIYRINMFTKDGKPGPHAQLRHISVP